MIQKLPQSCTVILRIRIGKVAWFAVYICGNFWVTQYLSARIITVVKRNISYNHIWWVFFMLGRFATNTCTLSVRARVQKWEVFASDCLFVRVRSTKNIFCSWTRDGDQTTCISWGNLWQQWQIYKFPQGSSGIPQPHRRIQARPKRSQQTPRHFTTNTRKLAEGFTEFWCSGPQNSSASTILVAKHLKLIVFLPFCPLRRRPSAVNLLQPFNPPEPHTASTV